MSWFEIICGVLAYGSAFFVTVFVVAPFLPADLFGIEIGGGSKKSVIRDDHIGFDK